MASGREPVERVVDLMVAVPVSILAAARQLLPTGVTRLERRVARDLDMIVRYARTASRQQGPSHRRRNTEAGASAVASEHAPPVAAVPPSADSAPDAPVADLPIEGYDQLSARQIVDRLTALTTPELAQIERHELAHRRRQTILLRIAQLT